MTKEMKRVEGTVESRARLGSSVKGFYRRSLMTRGFYDPLVFQDISFYRPLTTGKIGDSPNTVCDRIISETLQDTTVLRHTD